MRQISFISGDRENSTIIGGLVSCFESRKFWPKKKNKKEKKWRLETNFTGIAAIVIYLRGEFLMTG